MCQPYAASKVREYMDNIAIHETMVKVCMPVLLRISSICGIMLVTCDSYDTENDFDLYLVFLIFLMPAIW